VPFPDLFAPASTTRGTLIDIRIKRDPDGKSNDDLLYDLHFAHMILTGDPDDLARLDAALPGASATVKSAPGQNRKSTRSDTLDTPDRFLTLQDPISGRYLCWKRKSEVSRLKSRIVGPASTVVLVVRVRGLDSSDASSICPLLEREVDVTYEDLQPGLLAPRPSGGAQPAGAPTGAMPGRPMPNARFWDGTLGCVVAGAQVLADGTRAPMAGIVVNANEQPDGTMLLYVEDVVADASIWVNAKDVETTIHVVAPDGETLPDVLARYASVAASANVDAGWAYLVTAFGMAFAMGTLPANAGGEWVLAPEIAEEAIEVAARAAQNLGRPVQA
jgi:hypothetical protein